ncbi:MAG: hypothetical protein ACOH18_04295 [Candidatus Saccharimonadaceae bacterium]
MNIKQTMRNLVLGGLFVVSIATATLVAGNPVLAECDNDPNTPCCGNVDTALISCDQNDKDPATIQDTGLWGLLITTINIMIAGVGVLAVAGFVYGGILYTTSGGNPEGVKKARTVFTNVIIGVIAFGAMFTLLNFIVPGGVFN